MSAEWYLSVPEFVTINGGVMSGFSFLHLTWFLHPRCTSSDVVWSLPPHASDQRVLKYRGIIPRQCDSPSILNDLLRTLFSVWSEHRPRLAFTESTKHPPHVLKEKKGNSSLRITLSLV